MNNYRHVVYEHVWTVSFRFQLVTAMVNKLDTHDEPLPQDLTQGVDEDEWVRKDPASVSCILSLDSSIYLLVCPFSSFSIRSY